MRRERRGHTLQATALVNEAYIRLNGADLAVQDRRHFLSLAARTMRRILVDHARARDSEKRGRGIRSLTLDEAVVVDSTADADLLEIDIALEKLAALDESAAAAIELLFFGGFTYEQAADILGTSRSALFENARFAKAWLERELSEG